VGLFFKPKSKSAALVCDLSAPRLFGLAPGSSISEVRDVLGDAESDADGCSTWPSLGVAIELADGRNVARVTVFFGDDEVDGSFPGKVRVRERDLPEDEPGHRLAARRPG
jgi:hypothetical protein